MDTTMYKDRIVEGKYPLVNRTGDVRFFSNNRSGNLNGRSVAETVLLSAAKGYGLSLEEIKRLKGTNRYAQQGWRNLTDGEYSAWKARITGEDGARVYPHHISTDATSAFDEFNSQLSEKDERIKELEKQMAEMAASQRTGKQEQKKEAVNG